jgi:hypothetical protein
MKKRSSKYLDVLLATSMFLILAGFLLLVCFSDEASSFAANFWPLVILIAGVVFLYFPIAITGSTYQFFLGLVLSATGAFSTLVVNKMIHYEMTEWWPLIVVFSGIGLIAAGCYKYHRMLVSYTIPAVMLIGLGCVFLLFSFKIIHISFRRFAASFGPVFLVIGSVLMVCFFFFQKKYREVHDQNTKKKAK